MCAQIRAVKGERFATAVDLQRLNIDTVVRIVVVNAQIHVGLVIASCEEWDRYITGAELWSEWLTIGVRSRGIRQRLVICIARLRCKHVCAANNRTITRTLAGIMV